MNSYRKIKTAAKEVLVKGEKLDNVKLETLATLSSVVGSTLGPGGSPVLIERQEYGLPNLVTKDGVTVFQYMGFQDPAKHAIMEAARDAAVRTATEAGDGTTTATVLSEAIVRNVHNYCKNTARVSPQKVLRTLHGMFSEHIEPTIKELSITPNQTDLKAVAKLSANGDEELATAVMACFDAVGDDGSISLVEVAGPSKYEVETIKGFPISVGYEDSCKNFFPLFLNDRARNRTVLEKPIFILYHGALTEMQPLVPIFNEMDEIMSNPETADKVSGNIVVIATGFSENVLARLGNNFAQENMQTKLLKVLPIVAPKTIIQNSELHFLQDIQAVTGAKIFDSITQPLPYGKVSELGSNIDLFEMTRYRSTIYGISDEDLLLAHAEEVRNAMENAETQYDKKILEERYSKLVGGVAKLKIYGPSTGETREKRDRAEDAVFAVRGAKKHGCLPGGGWTLLKLIEILKSQDFDEDSIKVRDEVLNPSLKEPFLRLLDNAGMDDQEKNSIGHYITSHFATTPDTTYDVLNYRFVSARKSGILDSTPAVLEAIRNALSIASILGVLGGTIVYKRDDDLERADALQNHNFTQEIDR